jgi:RNA polymerase sigma-70 factor (sigma-E family)
MDREDAEDFRQFMAARSAALLRTAYLLTGDRGHAEDLVQNALTKTYRHWGTVRRSGVPEAYVRRILVNERNSRWRRERSRAREVVGDVPDRPGGDEAQAYADRDELWQALQAMPPRTRAVLVLRYWEDRHSRGCRWRTAQRTAGSSVWRPAATAPAGCSRTYRSSARIWTT